jgi:transcriptional regulator with XRE-family HTH domain
MAVYLGDRQNLPAQEKCSGEWGDKVDEEDLQWQRGWFGPKRSVIFRASLLVTMRESRDWTQDEFAAETGGSPNNKISVDSVKRAEKGIPVSYEVGEKIAIKFGVNVTDLIYSEEQLKKSVFNYNFEREYEDPSFGFRLLERQPGALSFLKWQDPGGCGYDPDFPYDVPNRILVLKEVRKNVRMYSEFYLKFDLRGRKFWDKYPNHEWALIHDNFSLGSSRSGALLKRLDIHSAVLINDQGLKERRVLEFYVPLSQKLKRPFGEILIRWRREPLSIPIDNIDLFGTEHPFKSVDFAIKNITLE